MLNHNVYYCTVFYHEVSWDILQTQSQMWLSVTCDMTYDVFAEITDFGDRQGTTGTRIGRAPT